MTDPTPEVEQFDWSRNTMLPSSDGNWVRYKDHVAAVAAAIKKNNYAWEVEYVKGVAAETERCAKVDPLLIVCPQCDAYIGQYCNNYCDCHSPRWRAAIRARHIKHHSDKRNEITRLREALETLIGWAETYMKYHTKKYTESGLAPPTGLYPAIKEARAAVAAETLYVVMEKDGEKEPDADN